ncbi:hypothetical protein OCHUTO_0367 [Orientia chuto str. Dubai]|uniref:Uncharacterized protein n=1 Tax=Orientia chuto str. Dubai TaxID=1359168 RepID=A0A0F3MLY5_9RICK|nr:hypothetical protein OCHUTO_0367 [Orientia chuto str. Dubai]
MNSGINTKLITLIETINKRPWLKYLLCFILISVATYVNYKLVSKEKPELFDPNLAKAKREAAELEKKNSTNLA